MWVITPMNTMLRIFCITVVLALSCTSLQAQEKKKELSISTGFATKLSIDDPFASEAGNGFHLGANLYKRNAKKLSWDSQLSMNYTDQKNSSTDLFTINALIGGRFYFNKTENPTRIFFSLLGGAALRIENGDDFTETLIDVGYSGGLYAERQRFVFGVSIDAPKNLIFKVGYTF